VCLVRTPDGYADTMPTTTQKNAAQKNAAQAKGRDAVALLKDEHKELEKLFKKFEDLGPRAHKTRENTVATIIEMLSKHAGIEELVFYPEVRDRLEADDAEDVLEALEEHHVAKLLLSELEGMSSEDERFHAKVTVLIESVRHHVKEEEGELFVKVREEFTRTELQEMGARLEEARPAAPSRPHPYAPDEPPANVAANALTAPIDAATRMASSAAEKVRQTIS
jgi:hemerythrin-like domain-containing protein